MDSKRRRTPPRIPIQSHLVFVSNAGQLARGVRYQVLGWQHPMDIADRGITVYAVAPPRRDPGLEEMLNLEHGARKQREARVASVAVTIAFAGGRRRAAWKPSRRDPTRHSYFIGRDPKGWHRNVPAWRSMVSKELYPGVSLHLDGAASGLRMRASAAKVERLGKVRLEIRGASSVSLANAAGEKCQAGKATHLKLRVAAQTLLIPLLEAPDRGQLLPRVRRAGGRAFAIDSPFAGPSVEGPATPLPPDPPYDPMGARYSGESAIDYFNGIALDRAGSAHVVGSTWMRGSARGYLAAVVTKYDAGGSPIYRSVLGSTIGAAAGMAIAVTDERRACITGYVSGDKFPVTPDAMQARFHGGYRDAFVAVLEPNGDLAYSTYLGKGGYDEGRAIAVDSEGLIHVLGGTNSDSFYVTPESAYAARRIGAHDAFIVILRPGDPAPVYGTHLNGHREPLFGSAAWCWGAGIAVRMDAVLGKLIYITGFTNAADYPRTVTDLSSEAPTLYSEPVDEAIGPAAAFVTVLNLQRFATVVQYSAFLGGFGPNRCNAIAVEPSGVVHVAGSGGRGLATTEGAFRAVASATREAFVATLDPSRPGGASLVYCSFLGGSSFNGANAVAVHDDKVLVAGFTQSADFPVTRDAFQSRLLGSQAAFLAVFDPSEWGDASRRYCSFHGGSGSTTATGLAVSKGGDVRMAGYTSSIDLPFAVNAHGGPPGWLDGYVLWLTRTGPL